MRPHPLQPTAITGSAFARFLFPPDVIILAVRWYLRFALSYRDVEELLAERGVEVDHTSVYRWVVRFTPLLAEAARPCRHAVGTRWQVDETYVRVAGRGAVARSDVEGCQRRRRRPVSDRHGQLTKRDCHPSDRWRLGRQFVEAV